MVQPKDITFRDDAHTELCNIMIRSGSDKGSYQNKGLHNYTLVYHSLLNELRSQPIRFFELGLGTNNLDVPSNMGLNGKPGASLRGWSDYFPKAEVFGADIDRRILFQTDRIKTFYCDQTAPVDIKDMWQQIPGDFDVLLEDGLHTYDANVCFFENSFHKVKSGGFYIIEDIKNQYIDAWTTKLDEWKQKFPIHQVELLRLKHGVNTWDNNIVVIRKA